ARRPAPGILAALAQAEELVRYRGHVLVDVLLHRLEQGLRLLRHGEFVELGIEIGPHRRVPLGHHVHRGLLHSGCDDLRAASSSAGLLYCAVMAGAGALSNSASCTCASCCRTCLWVASSWAWQVCGALVRVFSSPGLSSRSATIFLPSPASLTFPPARTKS